MPEDLMLPGIDPAPAAPAAPASTDAGNDTQAAPPQSTAGDDSATQSASVDDGAPDAPKGDEPPAETPDEKANKRASRSVQKRFDELVAREREAREEGKKDRELLAMLVKGILTPAQAAAKVSDAEAAPNKGDYQSWEDYEAAKQRYIARQEIRQELQQRTEHEQRQRQAWEQQQQVQQRTQAEEQLHTIQGQQMFEARARYPDYMDVIESCDIPIPTNVEAAMALTRNGGDVAYYLAKNPRVIKVLSQMPDIAVSYHITRIANAMRSSATSVSNAPPPGQPAGNRGTPINDYPKDATPQQHLEWEARNKKRQEKRA
jgi:hypothetical protein